MHRSHAPVAALLPARVGQSFSGDSTQVRITTTRTTRLRWQVKPVHFDKDGLTTVVFGPQRPRLVMEF